MLILFSLITLCIVSLAIAIILLLQSPGKVKPFLDKNGKVRKDSISKGNKLST